MDLVGLMLEEGLRKCRVHCEPVRLCPPMRRRFTESNRSEPKVMFNADRILNRLWDYPHWLKKQRDRFDLFHIVDHSYSQLVHYLPASRTIVTCHDLDAFRSVLEPRKEGRSRAFRAITRHTLNGLKKAAWITCDSASTRDDILAHGLMDRDRISVIANGVHPSCSPHADAEADRCADRLLGPARCCDLLHVGSTVHRKRIDVLLRILAQVRQERHDIRLIRVGGAFTNEQAALIDELNVGDAIVVLPWLERSVLAAVYRRASLLLFPSEREGFGLPLAEAMACGTPVIASDLKVLREIGGSAAEYCVTGDLTGWTERVGRLLDEQRTNAEAWERRRQRGLQQAAGFTWSEYARRMGAIYMELLERNHVLQEDRFK